MSDFCSWKIDKNEKITKLLKRNLAWTPTSFQLAMKVAQTYSCFLVYQRWSFKNHCVESLIEENGQIRKLHWSYQSIDADLSFILIDPLTFCQRKKLLSDVDEQFTIDDLFGTQGATWIRSRAIQLMVWKQKA